MKQQLAKMVVVSVAGVALVGIVGINSCSGSSSRKKVRSLVGSLWELVRFYERISVLVNFAQEVHSWTHEIVDSARRVGGSWSFAEMVTCIDLRFRQKCRSTLWE